MNRRGLFSGLLALPAAAMLPQLERLAGRQRVTVEHGDITFTLPPAGHYPVGTMVNVLIVSLGEKWLVWPQGHSMKVPK